MPENSPEWVSVRGVTWVLDEAPDVPPNLLPVLLALARHADERGRGAWLTRHRLAWNSRKAEQQVKRDLKALRDLGLIRLGDQGLVAHLPADKRPVVYDLAVERRRAPYEPRAGGLAGPPAYRGASQGPPRGPFEGRAGGPTRQSGGPSRAPKEGIEDDEEQDRSARARAGRIVRDATDATDDEIDLFLTWLTGRYPPRSSLPAYLARMVQRGHLQGRVDQWRGTLAPRPAEPRPDRPAQEGAVCPCGIPGGADLTSQGLPKCALCRRHLRTCTADPVYCTPCHDIRQAAGLPLDPRHPDASPPHRAASDEGPAPPQNVIPLSPRSGSSITPIPSHSEHPRWDAQ